MDQGGGRQTTGGIGDIHPVAFQTLELRKRADRLAAAYRLIQAPDERT